MQLLNLSSTGVPGRELCLDITPGMTLTLEKHWKALVSACQLPKLQSILLVMLSHRSHWKLEDRCRLEKVKERLGSRFF